MCGIAGILNGNKHSQTVLNKMLDSIKHRGPDDWGVLCDDNNHVYLGSRRLSILDLSSKGKMPMFNADRSVAVCQNGEIYNYPQLKRELSSYGYTFVSNSDTEAILHGYEKWGAGVFAKLQGMFAVSIYDPKQKRVFLARDRIGIKPLYYLKHKNSIYFSSEVKSFGEIEDFSLVNNLDLERIHRLLGLMFFPDNNQTIIREVNKLPPAHYMEVSLPDLKIKIDRYWDLSKVQENKGITFEQATNKLHELLKETVEAHLMSDVPLGIMLSGGLDSSLISAMVKKGAQEEVLTFNARFSHKFNESEYAQKAAKHLKTTHQEIFIDFSNINKEIEKYIRYYDDLSTLDGGLITTQILCQEVKKKGVTVLLLGEGADELFGGYSWFGLSQLPFSLLPRAFQGALYYYAISRNVTLEPTFYYRQWPKIYQENYNDDVFRNVSNTELLVQLPNHLLMKVDKGSMMASVEARVPYLDHKVVEYVSSLPRRYKLKGDFYSMGAINEKYILRQVARKYLPQYICNRKKRGFMLSMEDVLYSDIDKVKDYIMSEDSISKKLLSVKVLEGLFKNTNVKILRMQKEYLLWRLFLLEVWKKVYAKK